MRAPAHTSGQRRSPAPFGPKRSSECSDEVVPRIVSTVADIAWRAAAHHERRPPRPQVRRFEPCTEAVLRSFGYYVRLTAGEHAEVRAGLERAVQRAPGHADAWAMLSMMCTEEHKHGFNVRADSLGRAIAAARRAVDLAPSNHLGFHALASALFFKKEIQAFRSAAERAIAFNPMDGSTAASLGFLMASAGDWEHGRALSERAMQLNPHHARWYGFSTVFDVVPQARL